MTFKKSIALAGFVFASSAGAQSPTDSARTGLTLDQAIELAESKGLAAQSAVAGRDAARWRAQAFNKRLLPQLTLGGNAANLDRGINPITLPDGSIQFVSQSQNQSSLGLSLSQRVPITGTQITVGSQLSRIDLFGNTSSKYYQTTPLIIGIQQDIFKPRSLLWDQRVEDLGSSIAERQYLEAREQIAGNTAAAFFDLYAAEKALANAQSNASVNATLDTLNQHRYEVAKIGENDLLQSHLAVLRATQSVSGAQLDRDRAEATLRRLLGMSSRQPLTIVPPDSIPAVKVDPDLAVSEALTNVSTIKQLELAAVNADRQVGQARLANGFGATVSAQVGFNQTSPQFGQSYQSPLPRQDLTVGVSMPVAQFGAGKADVQAAKAEQQQAAIDARDRRESLEEDARFSALQLTQTVAALTIAQQADTVAQKRFDVARNRYLIGKIDIGQLYIAQSEKDAAVVSYIDALRAFWTTYYRLRLVTLYDFATGRRLTDEMP